VDCDKFTAFAGLYHFVKPVDFETSPDEDKVRLRLRQGSGDAVEHHGLEAHFRRQDGLARSLDRQLGLPVPVALLGQEQPYGRRTGRRPASMPTARMIAARRTSITAAERNRRRCRRSPGRRQPRLKCSRGGGSCCPGKAHCITRLLMWESLMRHTPRTLRCLDTIVHHFIMDGRLIGRQLLWDLKALGEGSLRFWGPGSVVCDP
jgi:hypothetical protein